MFYLFTVATILSILFMAFKSSFELSQSMNDNHRTITQKVDYLYNKEIVLKNSIDEYIRDTGTTPNNISTLQSTGYLPNGFLVDSQFQANTMSFSIDENKIIFKHKINDVEIKTKYLNHSKKRLNPELGDEYLPYDNGVNLFNTYLMDESTVNHLYSN